MGCRSTGQPSVQPGLAQSRQRFASSVPVPWSIPGLLLLCPAVGAVSLHPIRSSPREGSLCFFGFHGFAQFLTPSGIAALSGSAVLSPVAWHVCGSSSSVHFFALNAFEYFMRFSISSGSLPGDRQIQVRLPHMQFGLAADGDTAGAAHACSVYHDCVFRGNR